MFLYVIRHGHPDYKTDTLLPDGKVQAELVARRMKISGVDAIYASSHGRAIETATPTSEQLGLPIKVVDWARELGKESHTLFPDGEEKLISKLSKPYLANEKYRHTDIDTGIANIPALNDSHFREKYNEIAAGLDEMLAEFGYRRNERGFYDVTEYSDKHIALFCHNGMGRVIVSHLLHIPYQYLGSTLSNNFTGVTVFYFDDGHRVETIDDEYRKAHPEFEKDFEIVDENNAYTEKTGLPETSPFLASYGDIGHLYFDGEQPEYFISKTGI